MIDQRDVLPPRRTDRPRHRAAQRPGVLTAAIREVGYLRPAGGRSAARASARASAGAIASGLAAASIGVLVTVLIATGGQHTPARHPAAAPTLARPPAARLLAVPRHVVPTRAAGRLRHTRAHHVTEPLAAPTIGRPVTRVSPPPSSGTPGISFWQQLAQRFATATWQTPRMGPPGGHRWP